MSAITITFSVDGADLQGYTDEYVAQLWHIAQANPAPYGDRAACRFTEHVGREIVRRWLASQPPSLWAHQGAHAESRHAEDNILSAATLRQYREWLVQCVGDEKPTTGQQLSDALQYLDSLAASLGHQLDQRGAE